MVCCAPLLRPRRDSHPGFGGHVLRWCLPASATKRPRIAAALLPGETAETRPRPLSWAAFVRKALRNKGDPVVAPLMGPERAAGPAAEKEPGTAPAHENSRPGAVRLRPLPNIFSTLKLLCRDYKGDFGSPVEGHPFFNAAQAHPGGKLQPSQTGAWLPGRSRKAAPRDRAGRTRSVVPGGGRRSDRDTCAAQFVIISRDHLA